MQCTSVSNSTMVRSLRWRLSDARLIFWCDALIFSIRLSKHLPKILILRQYPIYGQSQTKQLSKLLSIPSKRDNYRR